MKTEPETFSIGDLERVGREGWDGVRNYMARNYMRDEMRRGDGVLFYHSNASPPGVVGLAEIVREGHPDPTQFDPESKYHDPTSPRDDPRWIQVEVGFVEKFEDIVSLDEIKADPKLEGILVAQRGQRLSVQPVELEHFRRVRSLGRRPGRRKPAAVREKLEKLAAKGERAARAAAGKRSVSPKKGARKTAGGKKRTAAKAK